MILKGIIAEPLVNIYHKIYRKYVVLEKGVKVLYVKLQNTLYELPCGAVLFCLNALYIYST